MSVPAKVVVVMHLSTAARCLAEDDLPGALLAVADAETALTTGDFDHESQSEISDVFRALQATAAAVHADLKKQMHDSNHARHLAGRYQQAGPGGAYGGFR